MNWGDLFQDPDRVGQTEYLAVHEAIATAVLGTGDWQPETFNAEDGKKPIQ